jgi:hypothetical protein
MERFYVGVKLKGDNSVHFPLFLSDQAHGCTDLLRIYLRRLIKCQCEAEETHAMFVIVVSSLPPPP